MKRTFPLRQMLTLVLLFIVVSISLIVLDRRHALDPLREGLSEMINPVSGTFSRVTDGFGGSSDLQKQLDDVTAERDKLNADNSRLKSVDQENQTLREQAKVQAKNPNWSMVSAEVIGTDPTSAQKFVRINRGKADGIQKGMAVVDPNYYVGQVSEVDDHSAVVMLIIDTSMKVGGRLENSQANGTVVGKWQAGKSLMMEHIDKSVTPKTGEKVVTSDMTRQIPPGIIIGVVYGEPIQNVQNDQLEVEVRPAVDFNSLDRVWVVTTYGEN